MKLQYIALVWSVVVAGALGTLLDRKARVPCDGTEQEITALPGLVSICKNTKALCAGAIISNEWVLISAYCIYNADGYKVVAGSSLPCSGGTTYTKIKPTVHEAYVKRKEGSPDYNEIALLHINPPFAIDKTRKPFQLPAGHEKVPDGETADFSKWVNKKLIRTSVSVISQERCEMHRSGLVRGQFCAGRADGNAGDCGVTFGAPLIIDGRLIGIASSGYHVAGPDIYIDVAYYRDWIKRKSGV